MNGWSIIYIIRPQLMPIPSPPPFEHENVAINNFVKMLLGAPNMNNHAQLIMMSGIYLNNIELIKYSTDIDPSIVNTPVTSGTMAAIDAIFKPFFEAEMGAETAPA